MISALLTIVGLITAIGMFWQATSLDGIRAKAAADRTPEEVQQLAEADEDANKADAAAVEHTRISLQEKQAFLLTNVRALIEASRRTQTTSDGETSSAPSAPTPYLHIINNQDHTAIVNKLTVSEQVLRFLELESYQYSQLVPHIEIYKVILNDPAPHITEVKFPFKNNTDFTKLGAPPQGTFRGDGAGIKSVAYKMEGRSRNPFSKNVVDVEIKLFFQDVKTLFTPLGGTIFGTDGARKPDLSYSDLIRHSAVPSNNGAHRIKLVLGWNHNSENASSHFNLSDLEQTGPNASSQATFISEILNLKVNMVADLREHNLDFKEDGSVELTVKYIGALENIFGSPTADILSGQSAEAKGLQDARTALDLAKSKYEDLGEDGAATRALDAALTGVEEKMAALSSFIGDLSPEEVFAIDMWVLHSDVHRGGGETGATLPGPEGPTSGGGVTVEQLQKIRADYDAGDLPTRYESVITEYNEAVAEAQRIQRITGIGRAGVGDLTQNKGVLWGTGGESEEGHSTAGAGVSPGATYRDDLATQLRLETNTVKYITDWRTGAEGATATTLAQDRQRAQDAQKAALDQAEQQITNITQNAQQQKLLQFMINLAADKTFATADAQQLKEFKDIARDYRLGGNETSEELLSKIRTLREHVTADDNGSLDVSEDVLKQQLADTIDTLRQQRGGDNSTRATTIKAELYRVAPWEKEDKIIYFFLGDVLATILGEPGSPGLGAQIAAFSPEFRLLLGPVEITNSLLSAGIGNTERGLSIGLLPIEYSTFSNFLVDKIVGEGRTTWPLLKFIEELIKYVMDFVLAPLSAGGSGAGSTDIKLELNPIDVPRNFFPQARAGYLSPTALDLSATSFSSNPNLNLVSQTLLLSTVKNYDRNVTSIPPLNRRGHRAVDEKDKIFHFMVGGPRKGILKSIKFTTQRSGLFDVALYRSASSGGTTVHAGTIVPGKFSIKMNLVGNPFFQLGQMIFINTKLIDGGYFAKEKLYFGGYYVIVAVNNFVGIEKWETSIDAVLNIPDYTARRQLAVQGVIEPFDLLPAGVQYDLELAGHTEAAKESLAEYAGWGGVNSSLATTVAESVGQLYETNMPAALGLLGIKAADDSVTKNWEDRFPDPGSGNN